jgi:hypothetical protein
MIIKPGKVIVGEEIEITGFEFDTDTGTFPDGGLEAMYWAIDQLQESINSKLLGQYS